MTETPEYAGVSHLYEHMFFKANAVIPNQEAYMARVRELGIKFNGTTGTERVNYFFTTTSNHLDEAMVFMRDAIMTPKFDAEELDKERVVVTGEMDRAESSPFYWFNRAVQRRLWHKHPWRKDALGRRETVLAATPEMLRTIQKRYYVPNNSLLVVTGDVSAKEIFASADQLYADWKRAPDPFVAHPLPPHPPLKRSELVVVEKPVQTFVGTLVWHGPSTVPGEMAATYAADAFGTVVDEPSSRFQKALVDSGHCVGARLGWYTQRNVGPLSLQFQAAPDKIEACTQAVFAEIETMQKPGYVTAEELATAANTLRIAKIYERERPSALAHLITFWWASASLDYYLGYVDNVAKVTPADVTGFVTRYMKDKPFVFGALLSPEMKADGKTAKRLAEIAGVKVVLKGGAK
ncbi:MAG: insulinase family protein [Deltaproteobacteria bacterium]|jgi:zinc protease|nr:insulinase family protein [Deltaproteobacteria bacterium]